MSDHAINSVVDTTMEKIKQLVDVNTIIGEPITCGEGITLVPISKVTFGFASGGSDFPATNSTCFGGGTGAGVTISPIAFIVAQGTNVKILNINTHETTADKAVSMVPEVIDKISGFINTEKKTKNITVAETETDN